ncbi:efflux RND transporter permease subunit [Teredinibacter haidensis]|uniref:efflux RND transporter permease subunit n=1 Tax=Teredinibacter haidensis TaxID=2731755 RepID=UPI000948B005|nr:efflux RND transporter permease subunit [Teredinibacter haidensis]
MKNIDKIFGHIPGWARKYRLFIGIFYVIVIGLSFVGAGKIQKDDSLKAWFGKDSEIFKNQNKFDKTFGSNEDVYIVYKAKDGDIFSTRSLTALSRLHNELADFGSDIQQNPESPLNHTREVISLVNIQVTNVVGNNLYTKEFIGPNIPKTKSGQEELRKSALGNQEIVLAYMSKDSQYGAISIKTDFGELKSSRKALDLVDSSDVVGMDWTFVEDDSELKDEYVEEETKDYDAYYFYMQAVRNEVLKAGIENDLDVYYAGLPEIVYFQTDVLDQEMPVIFLGLFLIILILLLVLFRHPAGVIWPATIVVLAVLLTLGFIGWSGVPSSSLSDPMILLIILISVADAVHLISTYNYQRSVGDTDAVGISNAYKKAGLSCFYSSLTTIIGFGSLWVVKPSIPIANFGYFCAVGIMMAFFVTITLLPIFLSFWSPKVHKLKAGGAAEKYRVADAIYNLVSKKSGFIVACFAFLIIAVGLGIKDLKVDTNVIESYKPDSYIRKAFEIADKNMGGTQNIDFMIDLHSDNALYDDQVLLKIEQFQNRVQTAFPDLVVTGISIADVMKRVNQQLHDGNIASYRMPESPGEISQLLFLFNNVSPDERRRLISDEFDATRVAFMVRNSGSTDYVELVAKGNEWLIEIFEPLKDRYPNIELINAGGVVTFMHLFDRIAHSQISSFAITLSIISIVLIIVFRSLSLSLLAVTSSVVPVVITFGVMGWLGLELNQFTMIVAPIILGIAVDDSIHLINKLRALLKQNSDINIATKVTLREIISPLGFTSIVLSGGLLTMLYSSDASFQAFGYLSAIAIMSALVSDIILIPSICILFFRKKISESLVNTEELSSQLGESSNV